MDKSLIELKTAFDDAERRRAHAALFVQWCESYLLAAPSLDEYHSREAQLLQAESDLQEAATAAAAARRLWAAASFAQQMPQNAPSVAPVGYNAAVPPLAGGV